MGLATSSCHSNESDSDSDTEHSTISNRSCSSVSCRSNSSGSDAPSKKSSLFPRFLICCELKVANLHAKTNGPAIKVLAEDNSMDRDIGDEYEIDMKKVLGTGGFATVVTGTNKYTGDVRAIKCVSRSKVKNEEKLDKEIRTMLSLDHPNIIKLFQTYRDSKQIYLVMELCLGGELFDRIVEQDLCESDAAIVMQQILRAVFYMHSAGICHRDLKPENFLFLKKAPIKGNILKVIDFGVAEHFSRGSAKFSSKLGTPFYVAPEILNRWEPYTEQSDLWSCGVILYVLLSGILPFKGKTDAETLQKVALGKFSFPSQIFDSVSAGAKDMVRKLLEKKPSARYTAKQALHDPWLNKTAPQISAPLSRTIMDNLRKFSAEHRFKKVALQIIARHQDDGLVEQLMGEFTALDIDGDGLLTAKELQAGLEKAGIQNVPKELQRLIQAVDADGSGEIDYTEFLAATLERKTCLQENACWAAFRVFDKNGDGQISRKELVEVLAGREVTSTVSQEQIDNILADVDQNGDGFIDFSEFMAMMKEGSQ